MSKNTTNATTNNENAIATVNTTNAIATTENKTNAIATVSSNSEKVNKLLSLDELKKFVTNELVKVEKPNKLIFCNGSYVGITDFSANIKTRDKKYIVYCNNDNYALITSNKSIKTIATVKNRQCTGTDTTHRNNELHFDDMKSLKSAFELVIKNQFALAK